MSNSKIIKSIIIIIAVILLGYFFFGKDSGEEASGGTIKIGVVAPFTGDFAIFGERIRNGMELAREDISQSVEVIYEDVCLPADVVSATRKLIDADRVSWIGGSFCLIGFVPIIPIVEENNMLAFNIAANPDSTLGHKYIFSTNRSIKADAEVIAEFARKDLKANTAAIINYVTPLGDDYNKYFTKYFTEKGGQILSSEQTSLGATDFRTELTKIKALDPDVLFVVHLAKPLGTLIKQARELGLDSTILSHSESEDPNVLEVAGHAAEGFTFSSSEPNPSKTVNDFKERYKRKYGVLPDTIAANAYDSLKLQFLVYEKCSGDTECMIKELHKIRNYDGVSGKITIDQDGSASKPATFKVVKDGKFITVE